MMNDYCRMIKGVELCLKTGPLPRIGVRGDNPALGMTVFHYCCGSEYRCPQSTDSDGGGERKTRVSAKAAPAPLLSRLRNMGNLLTERGGFCKMGAVAAKGCHPACQAEGSIKTGEFQNFIEGELE